LFTNPTNGRGGQGAGRSPTFNNPESRPPLQRTTTLELPEDIASPDFRELLY